MIRANYVLAGVMGLTIAGSFVALAVNDSIDRKHKRELEEKKLEIDRKYYESMSSEDKANIEIEKAKTERLRLEVRGKEAEAEKAKAESKKSVDKFKDDILREVKRDCMNQVKDSTKDLFDTWVDHYETKTERKIDSLTDRVDRLADKMSDRHTTSSAPSSPVITVAPVLSNKGE